MLRSYATTLQYSEFNGDSYLLHYCKKIVFVEKTRMCWTNILLLGLANSDPDPVNRHVGAVGVPGPPGRHHLQHAGGRPAVVLLPSELEHQEVPNVLLRHQKERVGLIGRNLLFPASGGMGW